MQRKHDFDYMFIIGKLQRIYSDDLTILSWLNAPNVMLKGRTPTNYIYRGRSRTVLDIIEAHL